MEEAGQHGTQVRAPGGTDREDRPLAGTGFRGSTPPDRPEVIHLLQGVFGLPRVFRLYPSGHSRIAAQLLELEGRFRSVFEADPAPLEFEVHGARLCLGGGALEGASELAAAMAFKLRRRRVRGLTFSPGVGRTDLECLARLLGTGARKVLRLGGAEKYLANCPHPHVEILPFLESHEFALDLSGAGLPPDVLTSLEETLSAPDIVERIEHVRRTVVQPADDRDHEGAAGASLVDFDTLLGNFFARPEWAQIPPGEVRRAVDAFMEALETLAEQGACSSEADLLARMEHLQSFFRGGARESGAEAAAPNGKVLYSTEGLQAEIGNARRNLAACAGEIRNAMAAHAREETSLLVLCELMVTAPGREAYAERRRVLLDSMTGNRFSSPAIARMLRFVALGPVPLEHESRGELIQAVLDNAEDEEALVLFLASLTDQPDAARPILSRLTLRPDPFALLIRLLVSPLLEPFAPLLRESLVEAARLRKDALRTWARRNRRLFLSPSVFDQLLDAGHDCIGPACKEILIRGPVADRTRLVERLEQDGTETALRLLMLGLPRGVRPHNGRILRALGAFDHPIAFAALRAVIRRNNTSSLILDEAAAAMTGLGRMEGKQGEEFLWSVMDERSWFRPRYKRKLRELAARAIAGVEAAK